MEYSAIFAESGYTKALALVAMEDKVTMVQTVTLHYVLLRNKAELDQFCDGLSALGVLSMIRRESALFN